MSESWNEKIIAEFRDNDGHVGGNFEGAPLVLLHEHGCQERDPHRHHPGSSARTERGRAHSRLGGAEASVPGVRKL